MRSRHLGHPTLGSVTLLSVLAVAGCGLRADEGKAFARAVQNEHAEYVAEVVFSPRTFMDDPRFDLDFKPGVGREQAREIACWVHDQSRQRWADADVFAWSADGETNLMSPEDCR